VIRLCVIGNSHLAAYKLGWDALKAASATPPVQPVFFGAPRDGMRRVKLSGGVITPTRADIGDHFRRMSGGLGEIRLADYDAFLLIGLGASVKRVMRFVRGHGWFGLSENPARTLVPKAFVQEFLAESYATTRLVEMAAMLRPATPAPILAVAEPNWAASAKDGAGDKPDYGWKRAVEAGDGPALGAMFEASLGAALAPHATFVPQAAQTVEDGILSADAYNTHASRLISGEGGGSDAAHMNGKFGQAMWPVIGTALEQAQAKVGSRFGAEAGV
jgi:hypothetical protein